MAITAVNTKRMLFNLIFNVAKYYHLAKTQRIACVAGAWKQGAQERTGARPFFLSSHYFQAPATQAGQGKEKAILKIPPASYPNGDMDLHAYRRIPVISPGLIQFRKGFWVGL